MYSAGDLEGCHLSMSCCSRLLEGLLRVCWSVEFGGYVAAAVHMFRCSAVILIKLGRMSPGEQLYIAQIGGDSGQLHVNSRNSDEACNQKNLEHLR